MLLQTGGIAQFTCQNGLLLIFVAVERRDALLGRAVFLIHQARFLECIQLAVPRQQQRRALTDLQIFRTDLHAAGADGHHFFHEIFAVQRDTIAQNIHYAASENAGRQKMQRKLSLVIDDGVAGVAAALIAHDDVKLVGQVVDHTTFSLIAPVDSHDSTICHFEFLRFVQIHNHAIIAAKLR